MFLNNTMDFSREMETYHFWPIFEADLGDCSTRKCKSLSKCYKSFGMIFILAQERGFIAKISLDKTWRNSKLRGVKILKFSLFPSMVSGASPARKNWGGQRRGSGGEGPRKIFRDHAL